MAGMRAKPRNFLYFHDRKALRRAAAAPPRIPNHEPRPKPGFALDDGDEAQSAGQKVRLQVSMRPVSWVALSLTRNFQVPLRASPDKSLTNVPMTLSALPPVRLCRL